MKPPRSAPGTDFCGTTEEQPVLQCGPWIGQVPRARKSMGFQAKQQVGQVPMGFWDKHHCSELDGVREGNLGTAGSMFQVASGQHGSISEVKQKIKPKHSLLPGRKPMGWSMTVVS